MIKKLPENLASGDVLAKDITSANGITVLKKGIALDGKLIEKIKKMASSQPGLADSSIYVSGEKAADMETIKKELESLEKRFELSKDDALMQEIKEIIKEAIIKNYGGGETA